MRYLGARPPVNAYDVAIKQYVDTTFAQIQPIIVYTITAATGAVANSWYRANPDPNGSFTVTLPTTPSDGTVVIVENTGVTNTVSYIRSGSDTIEGTTTALVLNSSEFVQLTYQAVNAQWFMRRYLVSPTAGTTVRRDTNGRSQINTPSVANDIANKSYVDNTISTATIDGGSL